GEAGPAWRRALAARVLRPRQQLLPTPAERDLVEARRGKRTKLAPEQLEIAPLLGTDGAGLDVSLRPRAVASDQPLVAHRFDLPCPFARGHRRLLSRRVRSSRRAWCSRVQTVPVGMP